jgi:hypothetical protein
MSNSHNTQNLPGPDSELLALGRQFDELQAAFDEVSKQTEDMRAAHPVGIESYCPGHQRFDKIAFRKARIALGYEALVTRQNQIGKEIDDLVEEMRKFRPRTLRGLLVKAAAVEFYIVPISGSMDLDDAYMHEFLSEVRAFVEV